MESQNILNSEEMKYLYAYIDKMLIKSAVVGGFDKVDVYNRMHDLCAEFGRILESKSAADKGSSENEQKLISQLNAVSWELERLKSEKLELANTVVALKRQTESQGIEDKVKENQQLKAANFELSRQLELLRSQQGQAGSIGPEALKELQYLKNQNAELTNQLNLMKSQQSAQGNSINSSESNIICQYGSTTIAKIIAEYEAMKTLAQKKMMTGSNELI